MRLIDADALSEKLCKTTIFVKDGEVFQRMINDAPTVSAEPKTGEWIRKKVTVDDLAFTREECDQCGRLGSVMWNFCPNCGADMRGGK